MTDGLEAPPPPPPPPRDDDRGTGGGDDVPDRGLQGSRPWRRARERAAELAGDTEGAMTLLDRASLRLRESDAAQRLAALMDDLETSIRMARARVRGDYDQPSWEGMLLLLAGLVYLVNPLDVMPDAIPGLGLVDDAAVLGWMLGRLQDEVAGYRRWERTRPDPLPEPDTDAGDAS